MKRTGENERAECRRALIEMTFHKRPALLLTATAMTGSKRGVKERIMLIAKKPKTVICTLMAVLLIAAVAVGCTSTGAEDDKEPSPVFTRLDEVTSIALWSVPNDAENTTAVREEHFDEMLEWVSAFRLGEVQKDTDAPEPGTNTYSVILTYADGSTDSSGIDIAVRDSVSYYIVRPDLPECWPELWVSDDPNADALPATVEIAEATDERLAQYADYDEFDAAVDDYGIRLLLTTDRTLRELKLFSLTWDEAAQALVKAGNGALYQQNELTPEKPLVVRVSFPGVLPTVGIEFIDADGTAKSCHIIMSGEDGSVLLAEATSTTEEIAPNTDALPATVEIAEATDERLAQYAGYDEFDAAIDDYGIRLLLTTDRTLREFSLFSLTWDDAAQGLVKAGDGALYQQNELTPEKPLVVRVSFPGTMPNAGIEFIDADGTTKSYHIIMSGEDGSVLLTKAAPTD